MGLLTALMWNFLFWLLEDLAAQQGCDMMSWIKTIEGLVMGIQCLGGELPFFFLSSFILRKIGHINAMSLVLFVSGIRFIYYSLMTNPWWCLPIEFCNGLTFGLFYATMASYASIVAPPGTETTTQVNSVTHLRRKELNVCLFVGARGGRLRRSRSVVG